MGWFSVLESSFRARREEVRTTFASNPVEVSIAAARQGRDAQPATEDTHSHTHSCTRSFALTHAPLPTRDQLNPRENCIRAAERLPNPIDSSQTAEGTTGDNFWSFFSSLLFFFFAQTDFERKNHPPENSDVSF